MLSAGIDPWDWKRGHTVAAHEMNRQLARYALRYRRVGIVLHPRCLRHPRERARFVALLDMLQRCSIATAALSKLAMGEITPSRRSALWALAALRLGAFDLARPLSATSSLQRGGSGKAGVPLPVSGLNAADGLP